MNAEEIKNAIISKLPNSTISVTDLTGSGSSFAVEVISDAFVGKNKIAQHKLVYSALTHIKTGEIHALKINTSPYQNTP